MSIILSPFIVLERVGEARGREGQEAISLLHKSSWSLSVFGGLGEMGKQTKTMLKMPKMIGNGYQLEKFLQRLLIANSKEIMTHWADK